jgi:hypothetical protein
MIQRQLKLRLNASQEHQLQIWLFQLTGVWNWAIRKIEQDAKDGIYYSQKGFHNLLANHGKKLGILSLHYRTLFKPQLQPRKPPEWHDLRSTRAPAGAAPAGTPCGHSGRHGG